VPDHGRVDVLEAGFHMSKAAQEQQPGSSARRRAVLRRLGWAFLLLFGVSIPLGARVAWEGQAQLDAADQARADKMLAEEIEHLGRAARWRLPIASHDEIALERLLEIGAEQEALGEDGVQTALMAYREVRRALLATRSWGIPHEDLFAQANQRIAALMAEQEIAFGTDLSGQGEQEAYHLALLERVPGPDPLRANLAALAFVGWIVASGGFVLRALDAHGRLRPRPALRWGAASLLLLVAWMILLRFAG
jgi:hypothetical protein